jgi:uncharacterized membrane protein
MESKKRSLAKALTWRVIAFATSFLVGLLVTKSSALGLTIALIDTVIKIFLYYLHERAWLKVSFGLPVEPDYQI